MGVIILDSKGKRQNQKQSNKNTVTGYSREKKENRTPRTAPQPKTMKKLNIDY